MGNNHKTKIMKNGNAVHSASDFDVQILVVDDEVVVRSTLEKVLKLKKFTVDLAYDSASAKEKLSNTTYALLLLDMELPDSPGSELLIFCKNEYPNTEVIVVTGHVDINIVIKAVKKGAFDYITKPLSIDVLIERVTSALEYREKRIANTLPAISRLETPSGYNVLRTLGAGNMGTVLEVEKDCVHYAMKILRQDTVDKHQETLVERFSREAKVLSKIEHPFVVKVYKFGYTSETNKCPYILMELVKGKSLTYHMDKKYLTLPQKIMIIEKIISALIVVHKMGIYHRDIKPGNILVTNDLDPKISDFGIAKLQDSSLTMATDVMGSPAYMAPESFSSASSADARTDIFSMGVLSYELITGRRPFDGDNISEIIHAVQNIKPIAPHKFLASLPRNIEDVIAKMLQKDIEDRYQNASQIAIDLENIKKKEKESITKTQAFFRKLFGPNRNKTRVWR